MTMIKIYYYFVDLLTMIKISWWDNDHKFFGWLTLVLIYFTILKWIWVHLFELNLRSKAKLVLYDYSLDT